MDDRTHINYDAQRRAEAFEQKLEDIPLRAREHIALLSEAVNTEIFLATIAETP